ncbi:MAG: amidohydrolase [SAR202 cluster bacterium]|nr:amidohydrolase [SAR202 cluster bacterium]
MIIDFHCHILPPTFPARWAELCNRDATFAALFAKPDARMADADMLVAAMDQSRVDHAVALGMGWTDLPLAQEVNDYVIHSVRRYPRRLSGFCSVNPAWGAMAVTELERCAAAGLKGVGEIHPDTQEFDIGDRSTMQPVMDAARRLGMPVVVHSSEPVGHSYPGKGNTTPGKLYRFVGNFPENVIICAHWGGGLPFYSLMPEVPEALKNVYFDSAASPFLYRKEVFAVAALLAGADHLLLGTDYPLLGHQLLLRQVAESGLGEAEQAAILGTNAARLLGLPVPEGQG